MPQDPVPLLERCRGESLTDGDKSETRCAGLALLGFYEYWEMTLMLVRRLESFHDEVVEELKDDPDAKHSQIVCWAVDGDRLMRSRLLLESVDLE